MNNQPVAATTIAARTLTELATGIIADLEANPPQSLTEARLKLKDLLAALRGSIEEQMVRTKTQNAPDYQAAIGDVQIRMEAVAAVLLAITDLEKAETAVEKVVTAVETEVGALTQAAKPVEQAASAAVQQAETVVQQAATPPAPAAPAAPVEPPQTT